MFSPAFTNNLISLSADLARACLGIASWHGCDLILPFPSEGPRWTQSIFTWCPERDIINTSILIVVVSRKLPLVVPVCTIETNLKFPFRTPSLVAALKRGPTGEFAGEGEPAGSPALCEVWHAASVQAAQNSR